MTLQDILNEASAKGGPVDPNGVFAQFMKGMIESENRFFKECTDVLVSLGRISQDTVTLNVTGKLEQPLMFVPIQLSVQRECDCGAKSVGVGDYAAGHSHWCQVSYRERI